MTWDALSRREKLIINLRAIADAPGHTATIISEGCDEIEIETQRADENSRSCSEFCKVLSAIAETTTDPEAKKLAEEGLRMPWVFQQSRTDLDKVAKAIREEIVRQYRDNDRAKCPAGVPFWEEEVQPLLLAEVAIRAYQQGE